MSNPVEALRQEIERAKQALWSAVGAEVGDPNYDDVSVGYLAEKAVSALASLRPSPEVETLIAQLESLYREMGTVGSVLGRKSALTTDDAAQVRMLNKWQGPIWDAVLELRRLASLQVAAEPEQPQHVCGLQGYQRGSTPDPICPACAAVAAEARSSPEREQMLKEIARQVEADDAALIAALRAQVQALTEDAVARADRELRSLAETALLKNQIEALTEENERLKAENWRLVEENLGLACAGDIPRTEIAARKVAITRMHAAERRAEAAEARLREVEAERDEWKSLYTRKQELYDNAHANWEEAEAHLTTLAAVVLEVEQEMATIFKAAPVSLVDQWRNRFHAALSKEGQP